MKFFLFLLFTLFLNSGAKAENSFAGALANSGLSCANSTKADLKKVGFTCGFNVPIDQIAINAWEIYDWNVFQKTAENQISKNSCMAEQIAALANENELRIEWESRLATAWLGIQKSKLILEKCSGEVFSHLNPWERKKYGIKKAYDLWRAAPTLDGRPHPQAIAPEWQDICFDEKAIAALLESPAIFQESLPVIGNADFFKTMEKHRDLIVNKNTQRPVTDEELLSADLQDLSFIQFDMHPEIDSSKKFQATLKKELLEGKKERDGITQDIKDSKHDAGYDLDEGLRDLMYQDGTLLQTLKETQLIPPDYHGVNSAGVSNGAVCLLSKFESSSTVARLNAASGIGKFAAEAWGVGKLTEAFLALRRGGRFLEELLTWGKAKQSFRKGALVFGLPTLGKQLATSCPVHVPGVSDPLVKAKKYAPVTQDMVSRALSAGKNLPAQVGYLKKLSEEKFERLPDLEIPTRLAPSCESVKIKNMTEDSRFDPNCALDVLMSMVGLKAMLPAIYIMTK